MPAITPAQGAQRRQRANLQKGRAGVEQALHPLAWEELAPCGVAFTRSRPPAQGRLGLLRAQVVHHGLHGLGMGLEFVAAGVELGGEDGHGEG